MASAVASTDPTKKVSPEDFELLSVLGTGGENFLWLNAKIRGLIAVIWTCLGGLASEEPLHWWSYFQQWNFG